MPESIKPLIRLDFVGFYRVLVGANGRGRTDDLRITNALLYQLSYVGEEGEYDTDKRAAVNCRLSSSS